MATSWQLRTVTLSQRRRATSPQLSFSTVPHRYDNVNYDVVTTLSQRCCAGWDLDLWDRNRGFTNRLLNCIVLKPLNNLRNLACIRAFSQTLHPSLSAIHRIVMQGCSTNMSRNYLWFDVTTTFCYPCYLFEYVSLHISRPHSFLNTPFSFSQTSNTSGKPPKKKINLNVMSDSCPPKLDGEMLSSGSEI